MTPPISSCPTAAQILYQQFCIISNFVPNIISLPQGLLSTVFYGRVTSRSVVIVIGCTTSKRSRMRPGLQPALHPVRCGCVSLFPHCCQHSACAMSYSWLAYFSIILLNIHTSNSSFISEQRREKPYFYSCGK